MALGQNIEIQIIDTLSKMADLVADPKRLKDLKAAITANEAAAKKAGVGRDLDKARAEARRIVDEAVVAREDAKTELGNARKTARQIEKDAKDAVSAKQDKLDARLAEADAALKANKKKAQALEGDSAEVEALRKKNVERAETLDARESELNEWAERLDAAVRR